MNPHLPKRSRARPRLNYAAHSLDVAKERGQQRKRTYSGYGVLYVRCGGGWRVLRRDWLPGDERG